MLLLLRSAPSGSPAANLGITLGLAGIAGPTAALAITLGLGAPNSVELNVFATPDVRFGLTGISTGFVTRSANVDLHTDLVAFGGFGEHANCDVLMGLTGTSAAGGFLQGTAALGTTLGLTGSVQIVGITAAPDIHLSIAGLPTISGGTVSSAATLDTRLSLNGAPVLTSIAAADIHLDMHGTGIALTSTSSPAASMRLTFEADEIRTFFRRG